MVWPYYMYFPLIASALFLESRRRLWLYEGVIGYVGVAFLGFCSFLILPSRMNQPDLSACGTAACRALQVMYDLDKGFHVFPSMHVAISVYTALFWRAREPRFWHVPGLLALAITLSTVLCKRHYVVDIPAGIMVALAVRTFSVAVARRAALFMRWAS
jgi:membrane-associated phospholipid phosphatase